MYRCFCSVKKIRKASDHSVNKICGSFSVGYHGS